MGSALRGTSRSGRTTGPALPRSVAARYGQGREDRQSRCGQHGNCGKLYSPPGSGSTGPRDRSVLDRTPSRIELAIAPRYLRSGSHPAVCREDRKDRATEAALLDDLGRHQGGEAGGYDAVEYREYLAALDRYGKPSDSKRG